MSFPYAPPPPTDDIPGPYGLGGEAQFIGPPEPETPAFLSADHLLDVARRALGPYADELERAGRGGWDILRAYSVLFERVSLAIGTFDRDSFPGSALGPVLTTVAVQFSRPTADAGAVTVKAGSLVRASNSGATFRTLVDAVFTTFDTGPITVTAEAVGYGAEFNVHGAYTSPAGDVWRGEIDTIDLPLLDPVFADQSIAVTNVSAGSNGQLGMLDVHGADVDVARLHGEADEHYQARVLGVADRVSPAALRRQVAAFMNAIGYDDDDWYLVEIPGYHFLACFDAPEIMFTFRPEYDASLFCPDDPRTTPVANRYVDTSTCEAAGILEIVDLTAVEEWGFAFDDDANTQVELATALGSRATPAPDIDDNLTTVRGCCYDGGDFKRESILRQLWLTLSTIKAHGVILDVHARGD